MRYDILCFQMRIKKVIQVIIAIAHIVGSILAVLIIGLIFVFIASWEAERNQKHLLEDVSAKLGVVVDDLNNEELAPRILQFSSERFSSELLKNRLSDLCGVVRTLWGWLGWLLQIASLIGVVWFTITENLDNAVNAWFVVGIMLFFSVASIAFSFVCRLLTGRYPGEAKQARKAAADFLKMRRTVAI
jgi:hypothetical protein